MATNKQRVEALEALQKDMLLKTYAAERAEAKEITLTIDIDLSRPLDAAISALITMYGK